MTNKAPFYASLRLKTSAISAFSAVKNSCLRVFCAFLWLKNPQNLRNLRLINDLRSTKDYVRKNNLFMQNKANFRKVKLNVNKVSTKDYEKRTLGQLGKTKPIQTQYKPNSKPIQTQLNPKQTQNKPKTNPNQTQTNPISKEKNVSGCPKNIDIY
ncbi:MAG: hypothetical protein WBC22_18125 [Sedimentisphaerales bacterium]